MCLCNQRVKMDGGKRKRRISEQEQGLDENRIKVHALLPIGKRRGACTKFEQQKDSVERFGVRLVRRLRRAAFVT